MLRISHREEAAGWQGILTGKGNGLMKIVSPMRLPTFRNLAKRTDAGKHRKPADTNVHPTSATFQAPTPATSFMVGHAFQRAGSWDFPVPPNPPLIDGYYSHRLPAPHFYYDLSASQNIVPTKRSGPI